MSRSRHFGGNGLYRGTLCDKRTERVRVAEPKVKLEGLK